MHQLLEVSGISRQQMIHLTSQTCLRVKKDVNLVKNLAILAILVILMRPGVLSMGLGRCQQQRMAWIL